MTNEKKKPEGENTETKPPQVEGNEPPEEESQDPSKEEENPDEKAEERQTDEKQANENIEGAEPQAEEPEQPSEETPAEPEPPKPSVEDQLKAENFALKTQLEAMKLGFIPDYIEDAVVLAENIVKHEGSDIATALQTVAKKYPDWKQQAKDKAKNKTGFKIGADSGSGDKHTTDDKLNQAFGIKKKG